MKMKKMSGDDWAFRLDCAGPLADTPTLQKMLDEAPADAPADLLAELRDELADRAAWARKMENLHVL